MGNCEFHGHYQPCPLCRAEEVASNAEALREGRLKAGVFAWTGHGHYPKEKALKLYKSKAAAEKFAEKLNQDPLRICADGYVVRYVRMK